MMLKERRELWWEGIPSYHLDCFYHLPMYRLSLTFPRQEHGDICTLVPGLSKRISFSGIRQRNPTRKQAFWKEHSLSKKKLAALNDFQFGRKHRCFGGQGLVSLHNGLRSFHYCCSKVLVKETQGSCVRNARFATWKTCPDEDCSEECRDCREFNGACHCVTAHLTIMAGSVRIRILRAVIA
jgi:hypothetical protein